MSKRKLDADERAVLEIDGILDIETADWSTYVLGGLKTRQGFESYDWDDEEALVDRLLQFNGTIWAHNGGKFDTLWFLEWLKRYGVETKVFLAGQRIVALETADLILRDSAALLPMTLTQLGEIAGTGKIKTGLRCECEKHRRAVEAFEGAYIDSNGNAHSVGTPGCGGYCAIRRDMGRQNLSTLTDYLRRDCDVLWKGLHNLQAFADANDLDLCGTIGASSWRSARRMLGLPNAEWTMGDYEYARQGYFGGRTQVFQPEAKAGFRYDINSAYPAALQRTHLPHGERIACSGRAARSLYRGGAEGIFRAVVAVPQSHIPPLPVRTDQGRVGYPIGNVLGVWTGNELRYAESVGCTIQTIRDAVVWDHSGPLLSPYVEKIWELRAKAGPSTGFGKFLKLYSNSLTGKFAQKPEAEQVVMNPEEVHGCPASYRCGGVHRVSMKRCCIHKCWKTCGAMVPIGLHSRIFVKRVYRPSACGHIHWSAYLTADTRTRQLHAQLIDDGDGGRSAVYCDTDSCYSTLPRTKGIGLGLGEWKPEGGFYDFESYAPKTYSYIDSETGEFVARSKGIPEAARNFHLLKTGVDIDRGVYSMKTAARQNNLFSRKSLRRQIRPDGLHFGDRILCGSFTMAQDYGQLVEQ